VAKTGTGYIVRNRLILLIKPKDSRVNWVQAIIVYDLFSRVNWVQAIIVYDLFHAQVLTAHKSPHFKIGLCIGGPQNISQYSNVKVWTKAGPISQLVLHTAWGLSSLEDVYSQWFPKRAVLHWRHVLSFHGRTCTACPFEQLHCPINTEMFQSTLFR
jgi:hypothetical protein